MLVFALNPGAARSLSKSFARRQVRKTYLAVVRGFIAEQGEVDYPLERSETGEVFDKPEVVPAEPAEAAAGARS